jgi:hypothetical protein
VTPAPQRTRFGDDVPHGAPPGCGPHRNAVWPPHKLALI